jgi:PleD family two-component response regulator
MEMRASTENSNPGESAAFADNLRSTAATRSSSSKLCAAAKTVLIADDNAYIRRTLYELFQSQADFDVCGEAENGKEAIEKLKSWAWEAPSDQSHICLTD